MVTKKIHSTPSSPAIFPIADMSAFLNLFRTNSEWRDELRKLVLTEELLQLPEIVRNIAVSVRELTEAQKKNEARFTRIETDIVEIKQDVSVLKQDVSILKQDFQGQRQEFKSLRQEFREFKGSDLERKVRERPFAFLGRLAIRLRPVYQTKIAQLLDDAAEQGLLTDAECDDAQLIDALAVGRAYDSQVPTYYAVEISLVIDAYDVERAARRAALFARATGHPARAVVLGESILPTAQMIAEQSQVSVTLLGA